jgi:hypothetical protein
MTRQVTVDAIADAILSAAREWGSIGITFAQLERTIPGFGGDAVLYDFNDYNVIVWQDLSGEAVRAIRSLLDRGAVHLRRTSFEAHRLDGRALKLKVEQRTPPPPGTIVWRPTAIVAGPKPDAQTQRGG